MAKRISSGEPKPRRTPARRRTEKPAASPVSPAVEPVVDAAAAAPEVAPPAAAPAPAARTAPQEKPVAAAGEGTLTARVSRAASTEAVWGQEGARPDPKAVARRAFELFLARGGAHGHDVEDWLAAERELRRR